jgi:site-specific DNA-methyltransferase (adenine-specific)
MRTHINIPVFYKHLPAYRPQKTQGHSPVHKYCKHSSDGSNYGKTEINTSGGGQTDRYPTTIIDIPYKSIKNRIHSQQKPVELFEWLIKTYTDAGQTVCDITAGSGTAGEACVKTGRNFILFEKDYEIFRRAEKRIDSILALPVLKEAT